MVRPDDTEESLASKVMAAAVLGTLQATQTGFHYLSDSWKQNTEEEALLGVSLTGIMDNSLMNNPDDPGLPDRLERLRDTVIAKNAEWADKLGIQQAAGTTCVKPEGCRVGSATVVLDGGVYSLDELADAQQKNLRTMRGERVVGFHDNGVKSTLRVEFAYGLSDVCTPNHKWWVVARRNAKAHTNQKSFVPGWVEAKDLTPGVDIIETSIGVFSIDRDDIQLTPAEYSNRSNNRASALQPTYLTTDLAWLLGYLWGNGCMKAVKHRFYFVDQWRKSIDRVADILLREFGIESDVLRCKHKDAWELEFASAELTSWFKANGFYKYKDRTTHTLNNIPLKVRTSRKHIIAFAAGMFDADACIFPKPNGALGLVFANSQDAFSEHMQSVLWSVGLGIGRSLNTKGANLQPNGKHMWLMTLSSTHVNKEAFELLRQYSYRVGDSGLCPSYSPYGTKIVGLVRGITDADKQQTFDIDVEGSHAYHAGIFTSHNTTSQLTDTASGIHPRHAPHYIRTVRADKKDPLARLMQDAGFPCEPDVMKPESTLVFSFPMKAPTGSVFRDDRSAIDQLRLWLIYQRHWCEHKPSITVYVKDSEWMEVGAWVYKHFDEVSGVSFLPHSDHTYQQAPYQEITEAEYEAAVASMPVCVDWSAITRYETEDRTTSSQTLACTGGVCEVLDLT